MADELPTRCVACGATLMGRLTRHRPDCKIWLTMDRIAPGCMPPTAAPDEQRVLACARATAAHGFCEGTEFGVYCSQCGTEVGVSVSGQVALREDSNMNVMCLECARAEARRGRVARYEAVRGAAEEFAKEIQSRRRKATKAILN